MGQILFYRSTKYKIKSSTTRDNSAGVSGHFGLIVAAVAWQVAASGKERKELNNSILQSHKDVPGVDATVSSATVERGAPWSVVPEPLISDP